MKILNPFITSGYRGSKYFCNRELEVEHILDAVENGRNLTLYSHRRMGKSVLLRHVLAKLARKGYLGLYIDIYSTSTIKGFIQKVAEAISLAKIDNRDNVIMRIIKSLGASLSVDPLSGLPSLDFSYVRNENIYGSLKEIFTIISKQSKKVVIAIDEFQEVLGYNDELDVEAEIRSIVQSFPQIVFLFSGSQKHLMLDMFGSSKRPFFQSTQMMELREIPNESYSRFIMKMLRQKSVKFDEDVIYSLLEDTLTHTYYTQFLLNRLYGSAQGKVNLDHYLVVYQTILDEQEALAHTYRKLLTKQQWSLLLAIAKETFVTEPYGQTFIRKYDLPAVSSVARSIKSLKEDGLIIEYADKGLRTFDVFLMRFLQKTG